MGLLKRKASIEASITGSAKKIERTFLAANQEFYITLEGRNRDMSQNEIMKVRLFYS